MDEWRETLISPDLQIYKAIEVIDRNSQQIAIVTDEEGKLLGTVTDGDIRRGILKEIPLSSPVSRIMNRNPVAIPKMNDEKYIADILKANRIRHLPVIDDARRVIGVERLESQITGSVKNNWVVIMAGGRGKRLEPLTDDCPKPMLKIGGKPVLQIIIEQLVRQGFLRFCISVNYRSAQIKDHFGDGAGMGAKICYVEEKKPMGTAGSLSLLPFVTHEPILVLNGDVLTKLNFEQLLNFHQDHRSIATIAAAMCGFQVPFGLIRADHDHLAGFEEKPAFAGFINAGVYVLNREALDYVPVDSSFEMNDLFKTLLQNRQPVCIFPIREYWIDIGGIKSYYQACKDYEKEFGQPGQKEE